MIINLTRYEATLLHRVLKEFAGDNEGSNLSSYFGNNEHQKKVLLAIIKELSHHAFQQETRND